MHHACVGLHPINQVHWEGKCVQHWLTDRVHCTGFTSYCYTLLEIICVAGAGKRFACETVDAVG